MKGKVVCLISGGIDSPVASYLMIEEGFRPVFVYFDNSPYADEAAKIRTIEAVKKLKQHISEEIELIVVPHGRGLAEALKNCPRKFLCVLCKRMMFRVAERIAEREGAEAIVTGEALGQKASQTLINLKVTVNAVDIPIIRPLIGMNKLETEIIGRKVGTFEIACKPGVCCSVAPSKPSTRAHIERIEEMETKIDIKEIIENNLKESERIRI
jgi:thiamine biosynthesis protein ThiI